MGMTCRPLKLELAELEDLQLPAILQWNLIANLSVKRGLLNDEGF